MHAPVPPHYKEPHHLGHAVLTVATAGLWGIVWLVLHLRAKDHNRQETERFTEQAARAAALNDAQRHADVGWHYQQYAWVVNQVRGMLPPGRQRPPFVVHVDQGPPGPRYQTPPAQRAPVTRPRPYAAPALHTPDAEPSGRHSPAVVETKAIPQVPKKQ